MSNRFADRRSEAVTKHMGRGSGWHDTHLPAVEAVEMETFQTSCAHGGDTGRRFTHCWEQRSLRFTLTCSNGIIQLSPLSLGCQRVKHRLVFPAAFWAWWGHLLDSHEPAKRGWEWYLPPYAYRHTTQKQLFSKKQSQHRLIASNNFYENV